jgi:hypothetical protein
MPRKTSLEQTQGPVEKPEVTETSGASAEPAMPPLPPAGEPAPSFERVNPAIDPQVVAAAAEKNTSRYFTDLEKFRLAEEEIIGTAVGREILTRVPVRRPGRKEFIRCHSDLRMSIAMVLYVDDGEDGDGEAYLVSKEMRDTFGDDVKPTLLQVSILRNGTVFLWPLTIPRPDSGRGRSWHESAMVARGLAMATWVKVQSDRSLAGYRVFPAEGDIPEPKWRDHSIEELLEVAFRDRIIKSMDHPIVRKYLGR